MRYCATLGFRFTHEKLDEEGNPTSIWVEEIKPRTYKADVISTGYRNQQSATDSTVDDYKISNKISVIACDAFTISHLNSIIYCEYLGIKWKVTSVDIQRPRLILTLGGEYHETENGSGQSI